MKGLFVLNSRMAHDQRGIVMFRPLRMEASLAVLAAFVGLSLAASTAFARYQQLRIEYPLPEVLHDLMAGSDLEIMGDDDGAVLLLSTEEMTEKLRAAGIELEVMVDDLEAFYSARMQGAEHRGGGNFGIFHTYSEMVSELNGVHFQFPGITSAPFSIGQSHEGRNLWAIKVSDNPSVDEDEGEVLFDGVHHAREIMTVEMNLDFCRYLCENYGTDPVVTQLVNSREIFFVPVVNPDGFVYNETTNPAGGGLWRKNRRVNQGTTCRGVDLNRNYDFQWVGTGSSTDPCNDVFRGPAPNSEPEIAAFTNFINAHDFVVWQSYHSVAGMVLFPWGYTEAHTPDDALFRTMSAEMARDSGYITGQPPEILYNVNGASFDWGYGRTDQHTKIYGFTTEIGGSGFWPEESERDGLIAENLHSNLYLCQVAGAWLELVEVNVLDGDNGRLDPGETADLSVVVRNPGLIVPASSVTAQLSVEDPYLLLEDASIAVGTVPPGGEVEGAQHFRLSVDADAPEGRSVDLTITLTAAGGIELTGIVSLTVGQAPVLSSVDFEASSGGWVQDPSHTATAGAWVRVDPNATEFQPGDDTTPNPGVIAWITAQNSDVGTGDVDGGIAATRSASFDLSGHDHVRLDLNYFHGQRDAGDDPTGDFFRIDISNNGGASYPVNLLQIGDQTSPALWNNLQIDLEDQIAFSNNMVLRVQAADGNAQGDIIEAGLDDILFLDMGDGNEAPTAPTLVSPPNGAINQSTTPTLMIANATDPEGQPLTYGFRVFADEDQTDLVASVEGVPQGGATTSWVVSPALQTGATYYWRAFASDGQLLSQYMETAAFQVGSPSDVLEAGLSDATGLAIAPNPAVGAVRIRYYTPRIANSEIQIFDASGRLVQALPGARWAEGWQEIAWDGTDDEGTRVPAGVYWVRLKLPTESRAVRLVTLR